MTSGTIKNSGLFTGTSGWSYPQWRGLFYPSHCPQRQWLSFYSKHFNAVEVNSSFYRPPSIKVAANWMTAVPDDFRFCMKVWRGISHDNATHPVLHENMDTFMRGIAPLQSRAGPLLLQLPPSFKASGENIERVGWITGTFCSEGWQTAVEFRNDSWLYADNPFSSQKDVAVVAHDMPRGAHAPWEHEDVKTGAFFYARFHGENGRYKGTYGLKRLKPVISYIRGILATKPVYVFFNNTMGGALEDARLVKNGVEPAI